MHEEHRQPSRAVVQIYITDGDIPSLDVNKQSEKLIKQSTEDMRMYAQLHDADYYLFTDRYFDNVHPQNEIFRVLDMNYDLILTADVDVVVNRPEFDIFDTADDGLTAARRPEGGNEINSGILVWGREGRLYTKLNLDMERAESLKNRDQEHLNEIFRDGFNYISDLWNDYLLRDEGIFHHYKGGMKRNYK